MKNTMISILLILMVTVSFASENKGKISLSSITTRDFSSGTSSVIHFFDVNGKSISVGYLGNGLLPYLSNDTEAYNELLKYKKKRVKSLVGYACFVGGISLSMAIGLNNETDETYYDFETGKTENKKELNPPALIGIGIALGGLLYGGANYFSANKHVGNSIKIFNSNIDKKNMNTHSFKLMPSMYQNTVSLNYSLEW